MALLTMHLSHETLGWISVGLVIVGMGPYFHLIYRRKIKPHAFSWLIWGVVTGISFFAEYSDHAGPGAWSTGVACITCSSVAIIAFFKGEHSVSRGDVVSLLCALLALPVWYFTNNPLGSIIIVTGIDMVGFYPTIRKSYNKPYEEGMFMYFITALNFVVALFAIENWTLITWLYPVCTALSCIAMVVLLAARRRIVGKVIRL